MYLTKQLANKIRKTRTSLGITQGELALIAKVSQPRLCQIERVHYACYDTTGILTRITKALGIK